MGPDTLVEALNKLGSETSQGPICATCAKGLATIGYKVCDSNNISKEN